MVEHGRFHSDVQLLVAEEGVWRDLINAGDSMKWMPEQGRSASLQRLYALRRYA
jgi:hypothetical protein